MVLIRTVGDKKIWIEHGQQRDEFNAFRDYGNIYALPVGYFITETFVSGASRHSDFGRGNWLKDIRSVGTMQIPDWILSNYFYREMSTVLRWVLLPFLLLSGVTVVAIGGEILRILGIFDYNILFHNPLMSRLGHHRQRSAGGDHDQFHIPGVVWRARGARSARSHANPEALSPAHGPRDDAGSRFRGALSEGGAGGFQADDKVAVFIFGHTHGAFLKTTGTGGPGGPQHGNVAQALAPRSGAAWLVARGLLSLVSPELLLHREENNQLVIDYVEIPKTPERELTWLQRLVTLGRAPKPPEAIPARTIVDL